MTFGTGEFMAHDLEYTGDSNPVFATAELLQSADDSLPLPPGIQPTGVIPDRTQFA